MKLVRIAEGISTWGAKERPRVKIASINFDHHHCAQHVLPELAPLFALPDPGGFLPELFVKRQDLDFDGVAQPLVESGIDVGMLDLVLLEPLDEIVIDDLGQPLLGDERLFGVVDDFFGDLIKLELAHSDILLPDTSILAI